MNLTPLLSRLIFRRWGARVSIDCQDSLRVHPCKLGRDVLSLTVLAPNTNPGSGQADTIKF